MRALLPPLYAKEYSKSRAGFPLWGRTNQIRQGRQMICVGNVPLHPENVFLIFYWARHAVPLQTPQTSKFRSDPGIPLCDPIPLAPFPKIRSTVPGPGIAI